MNYFCSGSKFLYDGNLKNVQLNSEACEQLVCIKTVLGTVEGLKRNTRCSPVSQMTFNAIGIQIVKCEIDINGKAVSSLRTPRLILASSIGIERNEERL